MFFIFYSHPNNAFSNLFINSDNIPRITIPIPNAIPTHIKTFKTPPNGSPIAGKLTARSKRSAAAPNIPEL